MRTLALLLLPMAAFAQSQLPAAQPYTDSPAVQEVIPGKPTPSTTVPIYQSTYTYTSTEESLNPRENALKESFKYALSGLLTTTFQPPVPEVEVKRLTEQTDPAKFIQSYRITSESFAPAYTLTTHITWSEKALLNALNLNTPAVIAEKQTAIVANHGPESLVKYPEIEGDITTTDAPPPAGPVQLILTNPQGEGIARLRSTATAAGHAVKMQSFSRNQAVFEAPSALLQALSAAGYSVEEDPTAFVPTYRIQ